MCLDVEGLPPQTQLMVRNSGIEVVPYTVTIGYDHFTTHEVLKRLLPEGMDIPSSFEAVGHVAHVNLREEHEPFKALIGQVILEVRQQAGSADAVQKNNHIRTVVNKIGAIDSTFRFFRMELIAGEDNTVVELHEEGCFFTFDYAKVYWNSRLQFEHRRLVQLIKPGSYICDMFCGVGPFALPAAKKKCVVYANDLNPESVAWLRINAKRNKTDPRIFIYNLDARLFVAQALTDLKRTAGTGGFDHFIMNLPASAHDFLDVFPYLAEHGLLDQDALRRATIHCYIFCRGEEEDPLDKIDAGLGHPIDRTCAQVRRVRDVAPNKEMFCVSFPLPPSILPPALQRPKIDVE